MRVACDAGRFILECCAAAQQHMAVVRTAGVSRGARDGARQMQLWKAT